MSAVPICHCMGMMIFKPTCRKVVQILSEFNFEVVYILTPITQKLGVTKMLL